MTHPTVTPARRTQMSWDLSRGSSHPQLSTAVSLPTLDVCISSPIFQWLQHIRILAPPAKLPNLLLWNSTVNSQSPSYWSCQKHTVPRVTSSFSGYFRGLPSRTWHSPGPPTSALWYKIVPQNGQAQNCFHHSFLLPPNLCLSWNVSSQELESLFLPDTQDKTTAVVLATSFFLKTTNSVP